MTDKTAGTPVKAFTEGGLLVSALKSALSRAPQMPLTVIWTDGEPIEAHFHVTEIGRVQRDFVDCGGTVRRLVSCLLQTWVGDDLDHRITAGKLLKALEHAEPVLRGEDLPLELEYEACNVVQLTVASILQESDRFVIHLAQKHTDCLAKDVCLPATKQGGGAGCC